MEEDKRFVNLGPIDPKKPNSCAYVYKPENYEGPTAIDAKIEEDRHNRTTEKTQHVPRT